jgi:hypothetical protein
MNRLRTCYDKLQKILGHATEPYESVALVEEYRQYWKPEETRVILLAESHVFTRDADRLITIPRLPRLPGYPTQYAKFVYCLGYGEKQLTENTLHPKRDGTPQFWKIFYSCNNCIRDSRDFTPILSRTNYEQRIRNKIELLVCLKQNGIWLVDSSIVALYDNGKKPGYKTMESVIEQSWQGYVRGVIEEAAPEHIICVGKVVSNLLEGEIKKMVGSHYTTLYQPNAYLSSEHHMRSYKSYSRICYRRQKQY